MPTSGRLTTPQRLVYLEPILKTHAELIFRQIARWDRAISLSAISPVVYRRGLNPRPTIVMHQRESCIIDTHR